MRLISLTSALVALFAAIGIGAGAQSASGHSDGALARLSYESGGAVIDWRTQKQPPQTCLAIYPSGYYLISRLTEHGNQTFEGAMPKDQFAQLQDLLDEVHFQSAGGGLQHLQGAESLVVEVSRNGHMKHYFWINPEDRNPLPKSALKVANWLRDFRARGATPFEHYEGSDIRICPSMNDNPMPLTSSLK